MNHTDPHVKAFSYFIIICLFSGTIPSIASAAPLQQTVLPEQSHAFERISNPSSLGRSSDILQMIQQVNASLLQTYIQTIQDFGPHPTGSTACDALETYLYDTLASFHVSSVRLDPWTYKLRSGKNIVATIQGNPNDTSIVIVSAHYDSVKISPGANDDGSGVAVVLAVADIMSKHSFNSTLRFVLFSGEEQGLLGSHEYAQNASRNKEHIIGDIQLDGVGYAVSSDDGSKIEHHANNQSAWMIDLSTSIATLYHEQIELEVLRLPHVTFSDHESFVKYHYAASYLWEYASTPYYHTTEDTLEHLNITYLAKVCKLTIGTLASMAELHPRLSNNDIEISIKGKAPIHPYQFSIRIENKRPQLDSANVTINIAMRNLRTHQYVIVQLHTHTIPCNWTFTKEITTFWEFQTMGRSYSNQLISLEVTVTGIKDDVPLYATQRTIGVILGQSIYLIPKY
jgi:hypothetical protein